MTDAGRVAETLPEALDGERIDRVVALLVDVSRREAASLLAEGSVTVDGSAPDKPSSRVSAGSTVEVVRPQPSAGPAADPSIEFEIVYEDDQVVVVDKPPHLVVHPGSGVTGGTLVNGLLARYPDLADVGEPGRPGIVHRLDKGTSGLLMVARTEPAYRSLVAQLAARTVVRQYLTLVAGLVEADSGLIDAPLGRSASDATVRAVVADGRPARTHYKVLDRSGAAGATLVSCRLETGRTHQIRAHFAAIGHPVVADDRYRGPDLDSRLLRPFLHAAELGFERPGSGASVLHRSPLPSDLVSALDRIGLVAPE